MALDDPRWATDATWNSPGSPWDGAPVRVVPDAIRSQGFKPGTANSPNANELNAILGCHGDWIQALRARSVAGDLRYDPAVAYAGTYTGRRLARPVVRSDGAIFALGTQDAPLSGIWTRGSGMPIAGFFPLTTPMLDYKFGIAGPAGEMFYLDGEDPPSFAFYNGTNWSTGAGGQDLGVGTDANAVKDYAICDFFSTGTRVWIHTHSSGLVWTDAPGVHGWSIIDLDREATRIRKHPVTGTRIAVAGVSLLRCGGAQVLTLPANWVNVLDGTPSGTIQSHALIPFGARSWLFILNTNRAYLSSNDGVAWQELSYSNAIPPSGANVLPADAVWTGDRLIGIGHESTTEANRQAFLYESIDGAAWLKSPIPFASRYHSGVTLNPYTGQVHFSARIAVNSGDPDVLALYSINAVSGVEISPVA